MHELLPLFILAPLMLVLGGILLGFVRASHNFKLRQLAYKERIAAIERGVEFSQLPAVLGSVDLGALTADRAAGDPSAFWFTFGIMAIFVGVGVAVFLAFMAPHDQAWLVGIVPVFSGFGSIVCGRFLQKRAPHV